MKSINQLSKMNENERLEYLFNEAEKSGKRLDPEYEKILFTNIEWLYKYTVYVVGERWPDIEHLILKSPIHSAKYAASFIQERWPEAEPVIVNDPDACYLYAKYVIKDRWPEGEDTILKDPRMMTKYIQDIAKNKRLVDKEPIIANDPALLSYYVEIFGRVKSMEQYIPDNLWDLYVRLCLLAFYYDYDHISEEDNNFIIQKLTPLKMNEKFSCVRDCDKYYIEDELLIFLKSDMYYFDKLSRKDFDKIMNILGPHKSKMEICFICLGVGY